MHEFCTEYLLDFNKNLQVISNIPTAERAEINKYFKSRLDAKHYLELELSNKGVDSISYEANLKSVYSYQTRTKVWDLYLYQLI